jgi:hypothetical protein
MTRIVVDEALGQQLLNAKEPVDLCDESGRLLGRVYPPMEELDLSKYAPCEPQITEEELQRREKSKVWYTTEQVLLHLKNLEKGGNV